ncbi:hypothetical protein [Sphingomonas yantingensis]|uniref:Uncharacterized protein n=1 Tax=Sphingomonas yantingensis TaxID=1241761 RepID=A0A7W9AT73_9SPHN|nr:hypothetical protein [Sphingomonas yantingensis]MBB5700012.1 hypothetical protein [Sphingomonas yantingensis]
MTFQNPLAFVKRKTIPLTINGTEVTGYAVDLEELDELGERYAWFGSQMKGEKVDMDTVPKSEMLRVANAMIAASIAPDASPEQRRTVEGSARNIDAGERVDLMRTIMTSSFPKIAKAVVDEEGNVLAEPVKPNRQQRRGARSKAGGAKPQT